MMTYIMTGLPSGSRGGHRNQLFVRENYLTSPDGRLSDTFHLEVGLVLRGFYAA